jgi:hypothetical protein
LAWGDSASDADRVIRDVGGWSRFTLGAEMGRSLLRPYAEATDTTKGVESLG